MSERRYGFVGLGQMGGPMAANMAKGLAAKGEELAVFDIAGTKERAPEGAKVMGSFAEIAAWADTLYLSLPDGPAVTAAARDLVQVNDRRTSAVVDLSTIGLAAARETEEILGGADIAYVDAPVSGGQSGARAGTITVMWSSPADVLESHRDVTMTICKNLFHVGEAPGQGQAMKMLNNFLSATAMAATSEAVAFGLSQGLEMKTILDVVNVSTGRNTATEDKFPNRILTGTYDAGFKTRLLAKDVRLFLENAEAAETPREVATAVAGIWNRCDEVQPDADFTRVYTLLTEKK